MKQALDDQVLQDIQDIRMLAAAGRSASGNGDEDVFWNALSRKHADLIRTFGFHNFKRTINFEYSQWGVSSFRDPKTRRLIRGLLRRGMLPWGGLLAAPGTGDPGLIRWPDRIHRHTGATLDISRFGGRARLRAYAAYCGLLWQYAVAEDRLGILQAVEEPALGNPLPIFRRGRLISQDLALSALVLNRIASRIPAGGIRRVLEIGAGYGRLAFLFRRAFPGVEYSILDIPPALAVSKNYLDTVFQEARPSRFVAGGPWIPDPGRFNFLLPSAMQAVPDGYFDLVINVSSFDEMRPESVREYFQFLGRTVSGWMYLQGYAKSRAAGHRLGLDEFPYGDRWRPLYQAPDPVAPGFVEKVLARIGAPDA